MYCIKALSILFLLTLFQSSLSAQKYFKSYSKTISYNQNGHSGTINFKCQYDVFMKEPIVKAIGKVSQSTDGCKPDFVNVKIDIYKGSTFIASKTFNNLISIDISGSPSWGDLWPGVSAEQAKNLYKTGYSIRNARATNLSFKSCDEAAAKETKAKEKQELLAKTEAAKEKQKQEAQAEAASKQKQAEAKKDQEAKAKQEAAARQRKIQQAQNARQQRIDAQKREQARREKNKQAKRDYDKRIADQKNRNIQQSNKMAASAMSGIVLIGMVMYQDMGKVKAKYTYVGNQLYLGINMGYSISSFPMVFNHHISTMVYDNVTGNNSYIYKNSDESDRVTTLNINIRPFMGYEFKYGGGELFGSLQPGMNLFFTGFNFSTSYGGNIYGGLPWVKLFFQQKYGTRNFTKNDWIDPEELGEGQSKFKYRSATLGIRFSFTSSGRNYARHHITLGRIYENITEGFDTDEANFRAYYRNLDIDLYSHPDRYFRIKGYIFEWNKEHNFRAYAKYYPNYPISGLKLYKQKGITTRDKPYSFWEIGFIRQIKAFY